jgi:ribonuclease-3
MAQHIDQLEKTIHYQFKNKSILNEALRHPSLMHKTQGDDKDKTLSQFSYERMEFLGDRVLGLIISNWLFELNPTEPEGVLAKKFSALVRTETLAKIAMDIDLANHFAMSHGEHQIGTKENINFLADACEVLIACLYLDGGLKAAKDFIHGFWKTIIGRPLEDSMDPKSALQEWSQAKGYGLPMYEKVSQTGPQHAPLFTVKLTLGDFDPLEATDKSKKLAEKKAAELFLDRKKKEMK